MTELSEIWGMSQRVIVNSVRDFVGCSLDHRREELAELVNFPGDDPEQSVRIKTNCAMFALGIWRKVGVQHPLLSGRYNNGMAMAWVLKIARDKGALVRATSTIEVPPPGALMHYANQGRNNDHVEFCLSEPNSLRQIEHAGGGRTNNAILSGVGPWSWNYGRPLQHWIDPVKLLEGVP